VSTDVYSPGEGIEHLITTARKFPSLDCTALSARHGPVDENVSGSPSGSDADAWT
jgi:hypothetical protein